MSKSIAPPRSCELAKRGMLNGLPVAYDATPGKKKSAKAYYTNQDKSTTQVFRLPPDMSEAKKSEVRFRLVTQGLREEKMKAEKVTRSMKIESMMADAGVSVADLW